MSIVGKSTDITRQGALFLIKSSGKLATIDKKSIIPGSLNLDLPIRELITSALKQTSLSRHQVAAEMSSALGKELTKTTLDTFSAESKETHRFPAAYTAAFAVVTGDAAILSTICQAAGGAFIPDIDTLRLELRQIHGAKQELKERERLVKDLLEAIEGGPE